MVGIPARVIEEIIEAKMTITPEMAIGLGDALGMDPQFWLNLESDYRMALARSPDPVLKSAQPMGAQPQSS